MSAPLDDAVNRFKSLPDEAPTDGKRFPVVADIEAEQQRYLWSPFVPLRVPTVLAGLGGLGKSTLAMELTARVTRGEAGGDIGDPAGVFFLSAEDAAATVLRPRLEAAGAKLDHVRLLGPDEPWAMSGDGGLETLAEVIRRWDMTTRLVVIDPWSAFMPRGVDSYKDSDIRSVVLRPLAAFAEEVEAAVLLVAHLNKTQSSDITMRLGGSGGLHNAARSVLLVAEHPEGDGRRVLVHAKANASALGDGRSFVIEDARTPGDIATAKVRWGEVVSFSTSELLDAERRHATERRDAAMDFLRDFLADGPQKQTWIQEAADERGLKWMTVRRAKEDLGILPYKEGFGRDGVWMWGLP